MPDAQFTVPYPQHTHFVGREEDLARLHAALQGAGPVGINPAALGNPTGVTGQGGIGKTQLAVAYAYKYRAHYPDGVYWLNAAESLWSEFANLGRHFLGQGGDGALKARLYETLRTRFKVEEVRELCLQLGINYEEFSPQLGISSLARELVEYCERRGQLALLEAAVRRLRGDLAQPEAQDELVAHAFARLRERSQCLLILDNVADPAALDESLTGDCVPARLPGRVLFTTRRRDLGRFRPVELKTLLPEAALELLLRDSRRRPALDPAYPEHEIANDICAVFGYLPLALEIAAAHLAKFPDAPLAVYRRELEQRGALDVMADRRVSVKTRHEAGLAAALAAQWATLGEEAQMVLRVAGQLSEAAYVPSARLGLLAGVPEERRFFEVTLAAALSELQNASLIEELAGDQARLHPLVREFARDRTPHAEKDAFRAECVRRLLTALGNIEMLERQVDGRGIDAILYDLLAAQALLDGSGDADTWRDLRACLWVLRREAHNLRGWRRDDMPNFLAQQLHLRLFDSQTPTLFGDLAARLRSCRRAWLPRWAARTELSGLEMTMTSPRIRGDVVVTLNGQRVIFGGDFGTLLLGNLDTGKVERVLAGHTDFVWDLFVTPDGQRAVSQGSKALCVWNLDAGEVEQTLIVHKQRLMAVADGRRAITSSSDGTQHLWDLSTGNELSRVVLDSNASCTIVTSGQPQQVVTGTVGGAVYVWNLDTGIGVRASTDHKDRVLAVAVTPDGERIISGSTDGTLHSWNLKTGKVERLLTNHEHLTRMEIMPDGQRVAYSTAVVHCVS